MLRLVRSRTNRVLTGVAAGLAERLAVDPTLVRVGFAVLALAGGAGVLLYLVLALIAADPQAENAPPVRTPRSGARPVIAVSCLVLGTLLLLREAGLWFGDAFVWPIALAALGATVIWTRADEAERSRWRPLLASADGSAEAVVTARVSPLRLGIGALLIIAGMATFLAANSALSATRGFVIAVVVTVAGVTLIFGPWVWRLATQVAEERRQRIRSQERAAMAAHLHDSVLQTLALIQRTDAPREIASLARVQERELRGWLYGQSGASDNGSLSGSIDKMAGRIEELHHINVQAVVVGDMTLDDRVKALVDACGEATLNAAKHSGAGVVSAYVEVDNGEVTAYIRDQGSGFDPNDVPADRRGIADSIRGRMARVGGTATIKSAPGRGTEVTLRLPRRLP